MGVRRLKPSSLWKGILDPAQPRVQEYAQLLCGLIPPEDHARFCCKMLYWLEHTPQNPIQLTAGRDRIFAVTRGQSRFLASVLLHRPCPVRLWAYHTTPEFPIEQYLAKPRRIPLNGKLPTDLQAPIPEFEQKLGTYTYTHKMPTTLDEWLDFLSPGEAPAVEPE